MEFGQASPGPARGRAGARLLSLLLGLLVAGALPALASGGHVSEANLVLPDLGDVSLVAFFGTISGWTLLAYGLLVCLGGPAFGAVFFRPDPRPPVHLAMAAVRELLAARL